MAEPKAIARVRADLAAGRTHQAVQRLRSLLAHDPNNLEARWLLASVYRRTGNLAEAGRWAYLSDDLRPEELAAFSRSQPSPWVRLRVLHWSGSWDALPSDAVRNRLRALVVAADQYGPPPRQPAAALSGPGPRAPSARRTPAAGAPRGRSARRRAERLARARRRAARQEATRSKIPCLYLTIILLVFGVLVLIGIAEAVRLVAGAAG